MSTVRRRTHSPLQPATPGALGARYTVVNGGLCMSALAKELSRKALALPAEERIWLAEELLATVQEVDAEVEAAWDEEIKRRIAEIDNGTARLILAEEVFAEVRRLIK